jgi:hypothetical protein
MDDIAHIRKLAGITEAGETFSMGKQEQIDTLVKDEAVFLRKVGQMINGLGSADLKRRLLPVLQDRVKKLDKYQKETSKGDESVPGGNFNDTA